MCVCVSNFFLIRRRGRSQTLFSRAYIDYFMCVWSIDEIIMGQSYFWHEYEREKGTFSPRSSQIEILSVSLKP